MHRPINIKIAAGLSFIYKVPIISQNGIGSLNLYVCLFDQNIQNL